MRTLNQIQTRGEHPTLVATTKEQVPTTKVTMATGRHSLQRETLNVRAEYQGRGKARVQGAAHPMGK